MTLGLCNILTEPDVTKLELAGFLPILQAFVVLLAGIVHVVDSVFISPS